MEPMVLNATPAILVTGMEQPKNIEDVKRKIVVQIGDLSRLLEMMPNEDTTVIEARDSFLKLSILIGEALDIRW